MSKVAIPLMGNYEVPAVYFLKNILKAEIIKFTVVESKDKENKVSLEKEKVKTLIPKRNLPKAS